MNWFKVYGKHVSSLEFTDSEIGKLVRYQAKVAHHERLLTEKETRAIFTRKSQDITVEKLKFVENFTEISLEFIAKKVLEDVLIVRQKYNKNVIYIAQQREKKKNDRDYDSDYDSDCDSDYDSDIDKIRQDKKYTHTQTKTHELVDNASNKVVEELKILWDKVGISKLRDISKRRKSKIAARIKSDPDFVNNFKECMNIIPKSDFLNGKGKTGWKVSFDWLIENEDNYIKVLEGNYDGEAKAKGKGANCQADLEKLIAMGKDRNND